MNSAFATLLVCMTTLALVAGKCGDRPKPKFDCRYAPQGVFFPHPRDCTFLIICQQYQDVAVSLCGGAENFQIQQSYYSLGCPDKCALVDPECVVPPTYPPPGPHPPPSPPTSIQKCSQSGFFPYPNDCKKAYVCSSSGAEPIVFNICNNVIVDSTFPVGCPKECGNWKPDVNAAKFKLDVEA